ncbi:MAG: LysR family transcriptional regulator [Hyphomicrobiales bacterium]|nr:LysR family transcriptional regulator [Hyphomicrobiales bacterium]
MVARRLSFARAAEELFVTKAAVAQQVRLLEEEIGAPLVERAGRGLRLTESGAAGAATLAEGFATLARAARAMREARGRRFLVINSSASFAATWLVGRIGKFKWAHPDIDVLVDANPLEESLDRGAVDAMIRWGAGDFPGLAKTLLFKEDVFPVCAPALIEDPHPLREPRDLDHHTLLHLDWNPTFPSWPSWTDWLTAAGANGVDASRGVFFNQMSMAIAAAAQGQGIALSSLAIAADDLASGRLVAPFATSVPTPFGYYFLCRPEEAEAPRIKALREFLVAEAALSAG